MDIDPHTLQEILSKVREQLRCPQCRKPMDALSLGSLKVVGGGFAVLQGQCSACSAHVMLHAAVAQAPREIAVDPAQVGKNASSRLSIESDDLRAIGTSLQKADGSFAKIFS